MISFYIATGRIRVQKISFFWFKYAKLIFNSYLGQLISSRWIFVSDDVLGFKMVDFVNDLV